MAGQGPFMWLSPSGSPYGFHELPPGGLCLSAFVFVTCGDKLLLGKYADDSAWETLAGLDATRRRVHGRGWTIPASHLLYGEDPRAAGRRVCEEILLLPNLELSEPRVETELGVPERFPEMGEHYDVWFFLNARLATEDVRVPPWYAELKWTRIGDLDENALARGHWHVLRKWSRDQLPE